MKLLDVRSARFLLSGGYAVNAFGYVRNTLDMELCIAADEQNQWRVIEAIREFCFPDAASDLFAEQDAMVRMGVPPLRIALLKKIAGVDFEDCWVRRTAILDGDFEIPMIPLEDLKRNKLASERPKDLLDAQELA